MAKREKRIPVNALKPGSSMLNFILKNKAVHLGRVLAIESAKLKLKNTKGHVLHLPLDQIDEVWAEEKVV